MYDAKSRCEGSCEVSCEMVSCRVLCSLNGVVSYKACHRRTMSPCPVEYSCIPGCGISSVVVFHCVSSKLKRPSVCVRSCRSMACWDKTKVHVAGVPLSSIRIDCRLRHSIVGCDDVVVGVVVGWWKAKGTTCASSSSLRANDEFLAVYGTSSPAWKRG